MQFPPLLRNVMRMVMRVNEMKRLSVAKVGIYTNLCKYNRMLPKRLALSDDLSFNDVGCFHMHKVQLK